MSEPRTEAGRVLVDSGIVSEPILVRAIEDEAARKERERITNLPRWTKGMEAVGGEWIRVAAITDTGEEAAS